MPRNQEIWVRARDIDSRLRHRLRERAAADDPGFPPALESVRDALAEYDALLSEAEDDSGAEHDGTPLGLPTDVRDRLAAARLELQRLEAGDVSRRYGIGKIRLAIPRLPEPGGEA